MINNDSIVTAYDEHLTLVEWLQKVEVLLKNGGLKETTLNDKGNATFSLTLTFNDGTKIESNAMTLASVNTALTNLGHEVGYHGFDMSQPFDKTNCVRIGNEISTEEWTLKQSDDEIELSDEDASKAKEILLKAIKYGFIAYVDGHDVPNNNIYGTLINSMNSYSSISATFVLSMAFHSSLDFLVIFLTLKDGKWKYRCSND